MPVHGLLRLYLPRDSAGLQRTCSSPRRLLGRGSPEPCVVVAAYGRLVGPPRGARWQRDGTRHQQRWCGWRHWPRPQSPPGETGTEHQATAPYHSYDMAWPPAVGVERPGTPGAAPWPPCQQCAPPHTLPPLRVLALGHALQDLALKVRRGGRLEQAQEGPCTLGRPGWFVVGVRHACDTFHRPGKTWLRHAGDGVRPSAG